MILFFFVSDSAGTEVAKESVKNVNMQQLLEVFSKVGFTPATASEDAKEL
jgi:hypothetical protein